MSPLGTVGRAVQAYLVERRRLGFAMHDTELRRFACYLDARGHTGSIDEQCQIAWARAHVKQRTAGTGTRRLETLRPFVHYYRQFEPNSVVVEPSLLGPKRGRPTPHIYTAEELDALVRAAAQLKPVDPLRPATYSTLFGLLAATGMRRSEALNLLNDDVDPDGQRLVIRLTKFRKSRQLPLHPSTASALLTYRRQRDQLWPRTPARPFFVGCTGMPLRGSTLQSVFTGLRRSLGWRARGDHPKPRIHDLRHTFAVRRVQRWYEDGVSIEQAIFWLCTYLGHGKITDTYWYLTGVPELMAVAGHRFEAFATEPEQGS
jgi:integrase/recombinase XerC